MDLEEKVDDLIFENVDSFGTFEKKSSLKNKVYDFLDGLRDSRYGKLLNHLNPRSEKFKKNLAVTLGGQLMVASPFYLLTYSSLVGITNEASLQNRGISLSLGYFFLNTLNYNLREAFHIKRKKMNIPILSNYSESIQRRVSDAPFNSAFTSAVCAGVYSLNCALGFDSFELEKLAKVSVIGASLGAVIGPVMGAGIDFVANLLDVKSTYQKVSNLSQKTKKRVMANICLGSLALNLGIFSYMPDSKNYGYEPTLPYIVTEKLTGQDLSMKKDK